MQLHDLKKTKDRKAARRVGRGGKRGTTSGRGQKGQKSRAGRRIRPALRDLISRIPKHRGFKNKAKKPKPLNVSLAAIAAKVDAAHRESMRPIDVAALKSLGLIARRYTGAVKVLGSADVSRALSFKGLMCSASTKAAVEKAGGTVS